MKVRIDCGKVAAPFAHFWESTGFTPASLLLRSDMAQTLAYVGAVPHGGIKHVRIHFLLDLLRGRGFDTPAPAYDWMDLDTGIDALVRNGLRPFFELMGNPSGFFSDFNNDGQLHAWRRMVRDVARHLMDRYGRPEVEGWYFETWNEPDGGWWHQWPQLEPFCRYYDACSEGLKEASPRLRFGGPGSCRHLSDLLKGLLAHCDSGTNYFTGEKGVRLDFLSVHEKGAWPCKEDITPDCAGIVTRETAVLDYVRRNHPRLARIPFLNNECDPIVGWSDIHSWHGRPYYAALIAKVAHQHQIKIVEELGCDYPVLSNDNGFLGAWGMRTHLVRFGDEKQIERGEFELVKKPALNVMALLALLGDERLALDGPGDVLESPLGALATRRGHDQVAVLVYHHADRTAASGLEPIELDLAGLPFGECALAHYRIDERHGDPFAVWERHGARAARPPAEALRLMREAQELECLAPPARVRAPGGRFAARFDLPLPGLSLLLLTRRPARPPGRVTGLRAERYRGIGELENVLVLWNPLASRAIRTYEVLFAESVQGAFRRIHAPDLLCGAFLHARRTAAGTGFYKVRAVDYWGRPGPASGVLEA